MQKVKTILASIIGVCCLFNSIINEVNAVEKEELQTNLYSISHREIIDQLISLNLTQQQEFCTNLYDACNLIEENLTHLPLGKKQNENINIKKLLEVLQLPDDGLQSLSQREISQITNIPLTVKKYLEFCLAMQPRRRSESFSSFSSSFSGADVILRHLDLAGIINSDMKGIIYRLGATFNTPLSLSPFNIYCFRIELKELKKMTETSQNKKVKIQRKILTNRNIADQFETMTGQEIDAFCGEVFNIHNAIKQKLTPYASCIDQNRYFSNSNSLETIKRIVKVFNNFHDLKEIKEYPLWKSAKDILTLEKYLKFCLDIYPQKDDLEWIPFYQKQRYLNAQIVLNHLHLSPNAQYCKEVRGLLRKLTTQFDNPMRLNPLILLETKLVFEKLKKETEAHKDLKSTGEKIEESILHHRLHILGLLLMGGSAYLALPYTGI